MKYYYLHIFSISSDMGGDHKSISKTYIITDEIKEEFIKRYAYDKMQQYYENYHYVFNKKGLQCIEKLGLCNQYRCDTKYFEFKEIITIPNFNFMIFENGTFPLKINK